MSKGSKRRPAAVPISDEDWARSMAPEPPCYCTPGVYTPSASCPRCTPKPTS